MSNAYIDAKARLSGRKAAIVGGGAGIGAGVTLALAGAGLDVAFCDIDDESSAETLAAASDLGVRAMSWHADVLQPHELDRFFEAVREWTDSLDILVNVAGGVRQCSFMESDRDRDRADIRRNFGYVIDSIRHAVPLIQRGGRGGSIINFTTIEAHRGAAGFAIYAGAKAATTNLTRALALEFGKERIRVNCVAPDSTFSKGNAAALPPEKLERMAALRERANELAMAMYVPLKQRPDVDALANAVLFLASDLATFVTGTTLHIDGGTMAASGFMDWPEGDGYLPAPLAGTLKKLIS